MTIHSDQVMKYVVKNTPGLDRIEKLRAIGIMFDEQGDEEAARDMAFVVSFFSNVRHLSGKPTERKLGGMDRRGI